MFIVVCYKLCISEWHSMYSCTCLCEWYSVYIVCVSDIVMYYYIYHHPNANNIVVITSTCISMYVMFDFVGNKISTEVGQGSPPKQTREGTFVV